MTATEIAQPRLDQTKLEALPCPDGRAIRSRGTSASSRCLMRWSRR